MPGIILLEIRTRQETIAVHDLVIGGQCFSSNQAARHPEDVMPIMVSGGAVTLFSPYERGKTLVDIHAQGDAKLSVDGVLWQSARVEWLIRPNRCRVTGLKA